MNDTGNQQLVPRDLNIVSSNPCNDQKANEDPFANLRGQISSDVKVDIGSGTPEDYNKVLVQISQRSVLMDVLSPEYQQNEKLKRAHKKKLLKLVKRLLFIQIFVMNIVVIGIVSFVVLDVPIFKTLDSEIISQILGFLKFFVGAVLAELIAMLFFIVKNVFDSTMPDLLKTFKDDAKNKS